MQTKHRRGETPVAWPFPPAIAPRSSSSTGFLNLQVPSLIEGSHPPTSASSEAPPNLGVQLQECPGGPALPLRCWSQSDVPLTFPRRRLLVRKDDATQARAPEKERPEKEEWTDAGLQASAPSYKSIEATLHLIESPRFGKVSLTDELAEKGRLQRAGLLCTSGSLEILDELDRVLCTLSEQETPKELRDVQPCTSPFDVGSAAHELNSLVVRLPRLHREASIGLMKSLNEEVKDTLARAEKCRVIQRRLHALHAELDLQLLRSLNVRCPELTRVLQTVKRLRRVPRAVRARWSALPTPQQDYLKTAYLLTHEKLSRQEHPTEESLRVRLRHQRDRHRLVKVSLTSTKISKKLHQIKQRAAEAHSAARQLLIAFPKLETGGTLKEKIKLKSARSRIQQAERPSDAAGDCHMSSEAEEGACTDDDPRPSSDTAQC
eukprot:Polyplicarium_translucidae@DN3192_c0_g1_i1.p1